MQYILRARGLRNFLRGTIQKVHVRRVTIHLVKTVYANFIETRNIIGILRNKEVTFFPSFRRLQLQPIFCLVLS